MAVASVYGIVNVAEAPYFEDEKSLKEWIRKQPKYEKEPKLFRTIAEQAATGSVVEIEELAGQTVAQIGKTELAVYLAGDADNASTNGKVYTLTYIDQDGVEHEAKATGTATLNGTPVAFKDSATGLVAVIDFYAAVSLTASAADANVIIYCSTAAIAAIYATISKTTTAATAAHLLGVGTVYGRSETDHADADSAELTMEYVTPWGEIKFAHCTLDTNGGSGTDTEVIFYEATLSAPDPEDGIITWTPTTTQVVDFYRQRTITTDVVGTTNSHSLWVCNADGSAIYGVIEEGFANSVHTRYMAPTEKHCWLTEICYNNTVATNIVTQLHITYTPFGSAIARTCHISLPNNAAGKLLLMLKLAPLSEVTFSIIGNLAEPTFDIHIIEAALA
jgi:hypothetical protein